MIRYHTATRLLLLAVAVVLGLTMAADAFQPLPTHAQATNTPTITIATDQASVYEGGLAVFRLTRYGGQSGPITVRVKTWEPDHENTSGQNETEQIHDIQFSSGSRVATLSVLAYIDARLDAGVLELKAQVLPSTDGSYQVGIQDTATVEVLDLQGTVPPTGLTAIGLWSGQASVGEGWLAPLTFRVERYGETSEPLSVGVMIEDPQGVLRGNHWDPPPLLPTQVEFAAGSASETLLIPVPDDQRHVQGASFKVVVLPSTDYLIRGTGELGFELSEQVDVQQNETAQQLELHFGKNGVNDTDANEGDTLKFVVKRRQQDADTGKTATFVVRVETDRGGPDRLLGDWTEDTSTGRLFKDFPLELTGSDTEIGQEIEVIENGAEENDWSYWASIRILEDWEGNTLTGAEEAEYWTVKQGFRETTIDATDSGGDTGTVVLGTIQTEVYEGAEVVFTLARFGGPMGEEMEVKVRSREPTNPAGPPASNSMFHFVTLDPWQSTATLKLVAYVDGVTESGGDTLEVEITDVGSGYVVRTQNSSATVEINDPPSSSAVIGISTSFDYVPEGGYAVFTLRRSGDLSSAVTVNLRYDDPHELLRGNHWDPPPYYETAINIQANDDVLTRTVRVPDDQRDGDGQSFTLTVVPSDDYLLGNTGLSTEITWDVIDNDTSQELQLEWGHLDFEVSPWEPGETYYTSVAGVPDVYGPAEGIFLYEDDRLFQIDYYGRPEEYYPVHFRVARRAEDVGQTATFVVRVEHNRGWESPRHAHWPIDPVTGNHYYEFPLTLTGDQRQLVGRIELLDNGIPDPQLWEYSAEIKKLEDVSTGAVLTADQEAEYWTAKEDADHHRKEVIRPRDNGWRHLDFLNPKPDPVPEGQQVQLTLRRWFDNPLEPLTVQVRTWEPNRSARDGTNPSEQIHTITFPAVPMTELFVPWVAQKKTITIAVTDDAEHEVADFLKAEVLEGVGRDFYSDDFIEVRIKDNDAVGFTVGPTAITAVGGRSNEYSVVMDSEPSGDVTVTIEGAVGTDLLVNDTPLTFTTANWSTAQTVNVAAVQNAARGTLALAHAVRSADDAHYEAATAESVIVTILEAPDHPLVQVGVATSGQDLTVLEGESDTYSIVLGSQPAGDVTVAIEGVAGTDLTLDRTTLTFTDQDWNIPQTVTVAAEQDNDAVDEAAVTLMHVVTSAGDFTYEGLSADSITVTVTDNDTVGVTVTPRELIIDEGASSTYTVMLDRQPTADVTVTIIELPNAGVAVDTASLTFTTQDWSTPQTVIVTAENDVDTINQRETITHSVTGGNYSSGVNVDPVAVYVRDDDSQVDYALVAVDPVAVYVRDDDSQVDYALVAVDPVAEYVGTVRVGVVAVTSEAGVPNIDYAVRVQSENVTARSGRDYEGVDETLEFAQGDFEAFVTGNGETRYRQTVYFDVGIIDNQYAEQTESFILRLEPELMSGSLSVPEIQVTIIDDDFVGVTVRPTEITVTEGATATYTVVLDTRPSRNVTVTIIDSLNTEVTAEPGALTFTPTNWHTPKTVTVAAAHDGDAIDEATTTITHTVSSAFEEYDGLSADSVTVTVTDDESVGVTISETSLSMEEGDSAAYTVMLTSEPAGDVTVAIEGITDTDLSPDNASLIFTAQNWSIPQTVTLTAEHDNDAVDEPQVTITHSVSSTDDPTYGGLNVGSIVVTVTDDDVVGVTVTPTELTIDEGASSTYTVVLDTQPTADVTVAIGGVADTDITLDMTTLIFTTQDWSAPQTVSVTAKSDYDLDDEGETITHSVTGGDYLAGVSVDPVVVTVRDDDPQMDFALLEVEPVEEDVGTVRIGVVAVTSEAGIPNLNSSLLIRSNRGTAKSGDFCWPLSDYRPVSLDPDFLWQHFDEFVNDDGETRYRQTMYFDVSIIDDKVPEETESFTLRLGRAPGNPKWIFSVPEVEVRIIDDDFVGVAVAPRAITVTEGATSTYRVALGAQPSGDVTVTIIDPSNAEVTAGPEALTFTPTDWYVPQTVTVAASHDGDNSDEATTTITHLVSSSDDEDYEGLSADSVTVAVTDDAGVRSSNTSPNIKGENSANDAVVLDNQPAADVTGANEGVNGKDLTRALPIPKVDFALVAREPVEEDVGTVRIGVVAVTNNASLPRNVRIDLYSTDDTARSDRDYEQFDYFDHNYSEYYEKILFSAEDFEAFVDINGATRYRQTVYLDVGIIDDNVPEETESFRIDIGDYHGYEDEEYCISVPEIEVTIIDDDFVGVTVEPTAISVAEGATSTYTVVLDTLPAGDVTVAIGGVDGADLTLDRTTLTFTDQDWDTPQTVTVTAEHDNDAVDEPPVTITHTVSSPDGDYDGLRADSVTASITYDDMPSVTVSFEEGSYNVDEGDTVDVTVTLSEDPERTVTVPLTKTDQDGASSADYSGVPASVEFAPGETEQTFTFTAASDSDNDDGESVKLGFGNILPAGVSTGTTNETTVTITDDDIPFSVTVEFGSSTYSVTEGGEVEVTVVLSEYPERTVTIPLIRTNQGGATDSDYSGVPLSVTFNATETEKTFTVEAAQDNLYEIGESVLLGFENLPTGVTGGTTDEATVTITNVSAQNFLTVNFGVSVYSLPEGGTATITVMLNTAPGSDATIPLTRTNQGGASDSDYSGVPPSVTFNATETEKTFTFMAEQDTDDDDGESVLLGFENLPTGVSAGTTAEATVSITDDDVPSVAVSFDQSSYTVDEGDTVDVTVTLDADPERTVTIPLTTTEQDGASNADYSGVPASVEFAPGETEQTFTFRPSAGLRLPALPGRGDITDDDVSSERELRAGLHGRGATRS